MPRLILLLINHQNCHCLFEEFMKKTFDFPCWVSGLVDVKVLRCHDTNVPSWCTAQTVAWLLTCKEARSPAPVCPASFSLILSSRTLTRILQLERSVCHTLASRICVRLVFLSECKFLKCMSNTHMEVAVSPKNQSWPLHDWQAGCLDMVFSLTSSP